MDSAAASAAHASGDLVGSAQAWEAVEAAEAAEAASMIASTGSSRPLRALRASRGDHACAPAARRGREPRSEPGGSRPIAADRPPGARHRTGLAPRRHGRSARGPCRSRRTEPAGSRARGRARRPAQPGVHPGPAGGPAAGAAGALSPYRPIALLPRLTLFIDSTEEPTPPPTVVLRFSRRLTILRTFRRAGAIMRAKRRRPAVAPDRAGPSSRRAPRRRAFEARRNARTTARPTEPPRASRPCASPPVCAASRQKPARRGARYSRLCSNP